MLNSLRIQNFKSWKDTGDIQFGAITGFFGTNSSGKTSILQFLLMLKQTVESSDRSQTLNLGDERAIIQLGTFIDIIHNHYYPSSISFRLSWEEPFMLSHDESGMPFTLESDKLNIESEIEYGKNKVYLNKLRYEVLNKFIELKRTKKEPNSNYNIISQGFGLETMQLDQRAYYDDYKFYLFFEKHGRRDMHEDPFDDFPHWFESFANTIYYIGPLRDYPKRTYLWAGENSSAIGSRGENTIPVLLSSRRQGRYISMGNDHEPRSLEEHIANWLKQLNLIYSFSVQTVSAGREFYEVRVKRTPESAEVFLTDVGFGVSQLLPVLVLLFYVPEGSTIILEQPEIHLHPAVQAGLADVFIDAIKRRNVQIILESHSEHLLQRLQRRLAEEALPTDQVKLYFTDFVGAASTLTPLDLDEYGNIRNWPKNFFGDTMGEASAMMEAELKRRTQQQS